MFIKDVGEVSTENGMTIRWTIPQYLERPQEEDTRLYSPHFDFCDDKKCWLRVYPTGCSVDDTEGWLRIDCVIPPLPPGSTIWCSMLDREGKETLSTEMERVGYGHYIKDKWIRTTELQSRREDLLPGGDLRIVCRVVPPGGTGQCAEEPESGSVAEATNFPVSSTNDSSRHANKSAELAETETNLGGNRNSGGSQYRNEGAEADGTNFTECSVCHSSGHIEKGVERLLQNIKDMYIESMETDFIISVKGREFRAHRCILEARIPAFLGMLAHNKAKNNAMFICMKDCDPDVFHQFLLFVYSGRVEDLSPDNMYGLYILAAKYGLQDLKEVCWNFMKSAVSVDVICDVIQSATTNNNVELQELAIEFFLQNSKKILVTDRWDLFLAENPTLGNRLLLKALEPCEKPDAGK